MSCRPFYQMLYNIGVVHADTLQYNTLQFYSDKAQNLLSKLHEHCLICFALCRIWNVCRNAALRRNGTFIRRIRCALSPKLNALFSNTSSLILITCDTFEDGSVPPSFGRREQGPAGDVSGGQSPVDAETSGPHLAAVRVPAAMSLR